MVFAGSDNTGSGRDVKRRDSHNTDQFLAAVGMGPCNTRANWRRDLLRLEQKEGNANVD